MPGPVPQPKMFSRATPQSVVRLGLRRELLGNTYHWVLVVPWSLFVALLAVVYLVANAVFAGLFLLGGDGVLQNARPGHFGDAFGFSVQTMATIGYGSISPGNLYGNVLVFIESFVSILGTAMATGLVFAKFARPSVKVMFSEVVTIVRRDGVPHLMLRAANRRNSRIVEANFKLHIQRDEVTAEGQRMRRFVELPTLNPTCPILYLSWLLMHRIDEHSPLFGATSESLNAVRAEVLVTVIGLDEVYGQTVHARHSYAVKDLRFGERFADMVGRDPQTGQLIVDYARFDETGPETGDGT
ncbi:MAG: ATP-sensitive inward rectifier potassium channel 10 [Myxococcales bacterium]|nr:ATP-sensitive inward rectifier potassium channel 10 [Myxococcales bacterium]